MSAPLAAPPAPDQKPKSAPKAKGAEPKEAPPDGPVSFEEAAEAFDLDPSEIFAAVRREGRLIVVTADARKLREGGEGGEGGEHG